MGNAGDEAINLDGYWLTDRADELTGWRIPAVTLEPSQFQVVFASGLNRSDPQGTLHTNFRLSSGGEYLALVAPDGETVVHEYAPQFPPQVTDVSYGIAPEIVTTELTANDAQARYLVPSDNMDQASWMEAGYDDSTWTLGAQPIGYETGVSEQDPMPEAIKVLGPVGYWRFEETGVAATAVNSGTAGPALDGIYDRSPNRNASGPGADEPLYGFSGNNSATGFDGRNDVVRVDASPLSGLGEFTMMGLIKPSRPTENRVGLWGQNDVVEFGFITPNSLQVWTPDGGSLTVDWNRPFDQWYHIAVVGDGVDLRLYIDGQLQGAGGQPTENYGESASKFNIGGGGIFDPTGNEFAGTIDEVAIFDRALSLQELASLFSESDQGGGGGPTDFSQIIRTDVDSTLRNQGTSLYVRVPFQVADPTVFNQLLLNIQYDDGFVAYLNGTEVARRNAPLEEDVKLPFDARALRTHADSAAALPETIDITEARSALLSGENILAIHGLNISADNADFLIAAQLEASTITVDPQTVGYMTTPSPGEVNNTVSIGLGPLVVDSQHVPAMPQQEDPILVTADVQRTLRDVADVQLVYRVMFGDEVTVAMHDDGLAGDLLAGDSTFTAMIPGGIAQPGEMVRWYVTATDVGSESNRLPAFEVNSGRNQSPEYFGTMIVDPSVESDIPILHWWVKDDRRAGTRTGTRASLYFNGEFYDNVFVRQRGGSTANNPVGKTNFKFDFKGAQFRFDPQFSRVEEFNLNSTATDKAYLRQSLSFDAYAKTGAPASISFPMHVRRNNQFYGVFVFIEEPDEQMLERNGLDPNGALYKVFNEFTSASSVRKKTRLDEPNTDLSDFIRQVRRLSGDERHNYLVDNVNLPATINYLVGTVLVHQNDNPHKNHFLYRDTEGTGEWMFLPWDNDLTWGSNWVGTSFSDVIYADVDEITFGPVPPHDPSVIHPSHPFINSQGFREWNNHWNRLMDALLNDPVIRQMYLRRLRTAMDELMGPPGTTDSYFDRRWDEYLALMADDAAADKALWANPRWKWGADQSFAEAVEVVKKDYLEVRRQHLYQTHSVDNLEVGETTVLVPENSTARYFVPDDDTLGTSWTDPAFDDRSWSVGETGLGFENSPRTFDPLIKTRVKPSEVVPGATSVYVRIPFTIDDVSQIENLTLQVKYDDGYVAYLNGQEVTRGNTRDDGPQSFDSRARPRPNTSAVSFENMVISRHKDKLRNGENVLAFHWMNSSSTSSDMLLVPQLLDGIIRNVEIAGIPHEQAGNPLLKFDPQDFDANPVSGNQDEEYLKIDNPTELAVDISGWRLSGGIEHTFRPGTIIPAGSSLYVTPSARAFRSRATGPTGGQGRLVQDGYVGHLSSFGETIQLHAADGTLMDTLDTPEAPSPMQQYLRVSEVHYNPAGLEDNTEFIELQNISQGPAAVTLDLTGLVLTQGPNEPFAIPAGTMLGAGEYLVLTNDRQALLAAYPQVDPAHVLGDFGGNLSNRGERIKIDDPQGSTIADFSYGDNDPWPEAADGAGASLVVIDPASRPIELLDKYYSWRSSTEFGGTPGTGSAPAVGIVVNEVLSHPDAAVGQTDTIEIHNTLDIPVDIGGWYLSDSADDLLKFQIPAGTLVPEGGYVVFDESHFNPTPGDADPKHFALDLEGDDVWIVRGDGQGGVAEFVDDVHFGAIRLAESVGRFPDGQGRLTPLQQFTPAAANSQPRVGPLVISEVQYHPAAPSPAALAIQSDLTRDDLEFVEIYNPTGAPLDLTNWRIRGGVDMNFDDATTIAAGGTLIVVSFNPDSPANAGRTAAFRAEYGLSDDVTLIGGYGGQLSDSFDRVELLRPDVKPPGQQDIPRVREDEVLYDDRAPWPSGADGAGASLQRVAASSYGNDPAAWIAASPSPGLFGVSVRGDFNGDGSVDAQDIDLLFAQLRSPSPDRAFDLTGDGAVDQQDRDEMIERILGTSYGDSNLDGIFNSQDLLLVFQRGKYEDGQPLNAGWADGDWDGDGDFNSGDLLLAFQKGGYVAAATDRALLTEIASALDADHRPKKN